MVSILQGLILGLIIVLPGMSGGTVFVIFGIYEKTLKDLASLRLLPYIPLAVGIISGIFVGGRAFALFFESYRDITVAFLLGCLLASIKPIVRGCPPVKANSVLVLTIGLLLGFLMAEEPIGGVWEGETVNWLTLFIGGALSSATMIIPGLPGSSVLIALGIYDNLIYFISDLKIGYLMIFGIGSLIGLLSLVKLLVNLFNKHKCYISYFFAGLIAGSSRALLPYNFSIFVLLFFLAGFILVWLSGTEGNKEKEVSKSITD